MIQVYKIMTGVDRISPETFFSEPESESTTRGHRYKVQKPRYHLKLRENVFGHRVVNDWNSLPDSVVAAESVNIFKNRLDVHWEKEKYIMPFDDEA